MTDSGYNDTISSGDSQSNKPSDDSAAEKLLEASKSGNLKEVQQLVENHVDPGSGDLLKTLTPLTSSKFSSLVLKCTPV